MRTWCTILGQPWHNWEPEPGVPGILERGLEVAGPLVLEALCSPTSEPLAQGLKWVILKTAFLLAISFACLCTVLPQETACGPTQLLFLLTVPSRSHLNQSSPRF